MFAIAATIYGVCGALAVLMQARQIRIRRTSCDVSLRFLTIYTGGYGIWLMYGLSIHSLAIIITDGTGLVCGLITVAFAVMYHQVCSVKGQHNV